MPTRVRPLVWLLAALLAAMVVIAPSTAVGRGPEGAAVFVDDPTPDPGGAFTASVTDCPPGAVVTFEFEGPPRTVIANLDGEAQSLFSAPDDPGTYDGFVTCGTETVNFVITVAAPPAPAVFVDNNEPEPGEEFRVDVTGCQPGEIIDLTFEGTVGTATTNLDGEAQFVLSAPDVPGTKDGSVTCRGVTTNFSVTVLGTALPPTTAPPPTDAPDPEPEPVATDAPPEPVGTTPVATSSTTTAVPLVVAEADTGGDDSSNAMLFGFLLVGGMAIVVLVMWAVNRTGRPSAGYS